MLPNPVALVMGPLLLAGRVFVNSNLPFGHYLAWSRREAPFAFVVVRWTVTVSSAEMAYTFAHEYAHWVTRNPDDEAVHPLACVFNPSYSECR